VNDIPKKHSRKREHCPDCHEELTAQDIEAGHHRNCMVKNSPLAAPAREGAVGNPVDPLGKIDLPRLKERLLLIGPQFPVWDYRWDVGITWPGSGAKAGCLVLFAVPQGGGQGQALAIMPQEYRPQADAIINWRSEFPLMVEWIEGLSKTVSGDVHFFLEAMKRSDAGERVEISRELLMLRVKELNQVLSTMAEKGMDTKLSPDGFQQVLGYVAGLEEKVALAEAFASGSHEELQLASQLLGETLDEKELMKEYIRNLEDAMQQDVTMLSERDALLAQREYALEVLKAHVEASTWNAAVAEGEAAHPVPTTAQEMLQQAQEAHQALVVQAVTPLPPMPPLEKKSNGWDGQPELMAQIIEEEDQGWSPQHQMASIVEELGKLGVFLKDGDQVKLDTTPDQFIVKVNSAVVAQGEFIRSPQGRVVGHILKPPLVLPSGDNGETITPEGEGEDDGKD
jgi:hypothetical protein